MEEKLRKSEQEISEFSVITNDLEQYSRRNNIDVHEVQKEENEDLMDVLRELAAKLELPELTLRDIETAHRVSTRDGRVPPILVRFRERKLRGQWTQKNATLKNIKIFINENLTKRIRSLFWSARSMEREKEYKFVWMRNGKILVRRREEAAVKIESERDLLKIQ